MVESCLSSAFVQKSASSLLLIVNKTEDPAHQSGVVFFGCSLRLLFFAQRATNKIGFRLKKLLELVEAGSSSLTALNSAVIFAKWLDKFDLRPTSSYRLGSEATA